MVSGGISSSRQPRRSSRSDFGFRTVDFEELGFDPVNFGMLPCFRIRRRQSAIPNHIFRFRGVEHRPVFAAVTQRQRLVPLDDGNGPRDRVVRPTRRSFGRDTSAGLCGSLCCRWFRREQSGRPAEKQLAVHLGIARQAEPAEQVIGVVDGAVVSADDDAEILEEERFNMYRTERGIFHSSQWQPESSQVSDRCICIISGRYTRAGFRWHGPFRHACWYQLERHHHQVY